MALSETMEKTCVSLQIPVLPVRHLSSCYCHGNARQVNFLLQKCNKH